MNSRVTEPLVVSATLASFAELLAYSAVLLQDKPQSAHFVDWSNHTAGTDAFYFFFQDNAYIQIVFEPLPEDATPMPATSSSIEGYVFAPSPRMSQRHFLQHSVTPYGVNLPVSGSTATFLLVPCLSSIWTLTLVVRIFNRVLKFSTWSLWCMKRKWKEGKLVRKVRLVVNRKHLNKHGSTFASTPSREEFLILMYLRLWLLSHRWEPSIPPHQ